MAKQKTGGQKKGTPNKITTDVRAEGTTRAAPAAAPSAGGLGPQYFGLRTMVLQERRTPVQCQHRNKPFVRPSEVECFSSHTNRLIRHRSSACCQQ